MKIIKDEPKTGLLEVIPEHADDLWLLSQVIDPHDEISGKTIRKIKLEGERKSDIIKKTIFLKLSAEKVEYGTELRISGKILEGPEDVTRGSYHTLTIESGQAV
ncbi:MAG: mRNA surveillance protein Pelota, partial [Nanoarchaeota archaeon]